MIQDSSNNQVFLILSDNDNLSTIKLYNEITAATKSYGNTHLLFNKKDEDIPNTIKDLNTYIFTNEDLYNLGYILMKDRCLLPYHTHFPVLHFYLNNPNYNYYWFIENDIRFSGDWKYFFDTFSNLDYDYMSSRIGEWGNYNTLVESIISKDEYQEFLYNRMCAFNSIYRLSNKAIKFINEKLKEKYIGHNEILFPTFFKHNNFSMLDFGGDGSYVLPEFKNKFYTAKTLLYRPIHKEIGNIPNKLYHPVKN